MSGVRGGTTLPATHWHLSLPRYIYPHLIYIYEVYTSAKGTGESAAGARELH